MNLGITGAIGSGKSEVLSLFSASGWNTLSADAEVHVILSEDEAVADAIRAALGSDVFDEGGKVSRARLGSRVFGDAEALRTLEGILHPAVRKRWMGFLEDRQGQANAVEIPLLFEKRLEKQFDFCVTLWVDPDVTFRRLEQRGMDRPSIAKRMSAQLTQNSKAILSDFVLLNNGSRRFLEMQVCHLSDELLSGPGS